MKKGRSFNLFTAGGQSEELGQMSVNILRAFGLRANDFIVDVGCGYGRLLKALEPNHKGSIWVRMLFLNS